MSHGRKVRNWNCILLQECATHETVIVPLSEIHRHAVIDIFNYYIENSFSAYLDRKVPYDFYDIFLSMMKGYPSAAIVLGGRDCRASASFVPITPSPFLHEPPTLPISYTGIIPEKGSVPAALEHLVKRQDR